MGEVEKIPGERNVFNRLGLAAFGLAVLLVPVLWLALRRPSSCDQAVGRLLDSDRTYAWADVRAQLPQARAACGVLRADEIAAVEGRLRTHEEKLVAATAAASADADRRAAAEAKMNAAYEVWIAFGRLPPEKRNKATWGEALAESTSHGATLGPPYDRQFQAANQAVARKHMAPLVNPETRAVGENFVVLVPSADRVKCLLWASQWSEEAEALRTLGFEKLRCDAGKHVSNITGKEVEDPPREWVIQ